jgi:hypothetical protein
MVAALGAALIVASCSLEPEKGVQNSTSETSSTPTTTPTVVDTDTPSSTDTDTDGDTATDTGGEDPVYLLEVTLTVDDGWAMWVDGIAIDQAEGWDFSNTNDTQLNLNTDGPHVIAVYGYDSYNVISGFMAEAKLNGAPLALTGQGGWLVAPSRPDASWTEVTYDDSWFEAPQLCSAADVTQFWGIRPEDLTKVGAQWIWNKPCRDLGEAWFRFNFHIDP